MSDKSGQLLPSGWRRHESRKNPGQFYFFHSKTGKRQWKHPTHTDIAKKRKRSSDAKGKSKQQRLAEKMRQKLADTVKCDIEVEVSHILAKHVHSRNPYCSWKKEKIRRSKKQALQILQKFERELKRVQTADERKDTFCALASKHSDCGSALKGGVLKFGRGKMQKAFEEASFSLKTGALSGIVDTKSGLHLIYCIQGAPQDSSDAKDP